jgi:hypothetical protein
VQVLASLDQSALPVQILPSPSRDSHLTGYLRDSNWGPGFPQFGKPVADTSTRGVTNGTQPGAPAPQADAEAELGASWAPAGSVRCTTVPQLQTPRPRGVVTALRAPAPSGSTSPSRGHAAAACWNVPVALASRGSVTRDGPARHGPVRPLERGKPRQRPSQVGRGAVPGHWQLTLPACAQGPQPGRGSGRARLCVRVRAYARASGPLGACARRVCAEAPAQRRREQCHARRPLADKRRKPAAREA